MAKYGGFFLKGLAGSLQGMPQRIYEVRWKAKQEKKLKDKEEELKEILSLYTKTADELYEDDFYSKEDISKLNTIILSGGSEFQTIIKDTHSHISGLYEAQVKQDFELIESAKEMLGQIDLKNIDEALENVRRFIKSEDAVNRLNAYEGLLKKQLEAEKELPKEPKIGDYTTATNYLKSISNVSPENFELARKDVEGRFGIDTSYITQDMYKEMNIATKSFYKTAEEAMASGPDILDMKKVPVQVSANQWKLDYQKETVPTPTPPTPPTAPTIENVREDIKNAPTIEDAKRIEKNHIAKYGDTLDIPNVDKFWSDERVRRLTSIKQGIDKLLDENKRLKKGTITSAEVGFDIEDDIQKVEAVYQQLREEYMKYRKLLEEMGVDLTQFPEMMSYDEYIKTDVKPKVIYDPRTWGKQKPPIY